MIETDDRHDLPTNHKLYGISLHKNYSLDAIYGAKAWQHRSFPGRCRRLINQRRFRNTGLPIGTTAVLIAIICDVLLIGAAALTAACIRVENPFAAVTNELLLIINPAFLLAVFAVNY